MPGSRVRVPPLLLANQPLGPLSSGGFSCLALALALTQSVVMVGCDCHDCNHAPAWAVVIKKPVFRWRPVLHVHLPDGLAGNCGTNFSITSRCSKGPERDSNTNSHGGCWEQIGADGGQVG